MKLYEAERKLNRLVGIRFNELFTEDELQFIKINKGRTGQLLELSLDMRLSNTNRDFEDGELKTKLGKKHFRQLQGTTHGRINVRYGTRRRRTEKCVWGALQRMRNSA